jgi:solute carrier family 25 (mitochondrial carnitine/acylcarnitine transporter), member 20/29
LSFRRFHSIKGQMVVHLRDVLAGTMAGTAQIAVGHPFDTVKVTLQSSRDHSGPIAAARSILRNQGFVGLYRGVGPPLATVAVFNAVLFSVNETLSRMVRGSGDTTRELTPTEAAIVGGLTGIPVSMLATPTELLKCRLQAQGGAKPPPGAIYSLADARAGKILYKGPVDALHLVTKFENGIFGLYRGLMATLWREVPGNAFYFSAYALTKQQLAAAQHLDGTADLGAPSLMLAGALAGMAFWIPMLPVDTIKTKLQTDSPFHPKYNGIWDCGVKIVQKEGVAGLFRGYTPCLARSAPANAVTFLAYEVAHSTFKDHFE